MLETAAGDIFRAEGSVQGHPADGSGDALSAVENSAIAQNACADAGADGEEDGALASFGRAAPGFAENVAGAVGFDEDGRLRFGERSSKRLLQREILPAGNIGGPNTAGFWMSDAWDGNANGVDWKAS